MGTQTKKIPRRFGRQRGGLSESEGLVMNKSTLTGAAGEMAASQHEREPRHISEHMTEAVDQIVSADEKWTRSRYIHHIDAFTLFDEQAKEPPIEFRADQHLLSRIVTGDANATAAIAVLLAASPASNHAVLVDGDFRLQEICEAIELLTVTRDHLQAMETGEPA
jgi:hypothetical protein